MVEKSNDKNTDLDRLAEEEILKETKRAKERAEVFGIEGYKKCPSVGTNKRFLSNTIVNNMQSNRIKESRQFKSKEASIHFSPYKRKSSHTKSRTKDDEKHAKNMQNNKTEEPKRDNKNFHK